VALGLAEAANWPCALRTTQRILAPGERPAGNSILQSGASVGAVLIPLVLLVLFDKERADGWRMPFVVVGIGGMVWVALWWAVVRPADLALQHQNPSAAGPAHRPLPRGILVRRFAVLIVLVVTINMTWHFIRVWGPQFLEEQHGYDKDQVFWFFMAYYIATDIGALSAGFLTLYLIRSGGPVHTTRRVVFLGCAVLAGLCLVVPLLPTGWLLIGVLLLIGFGTLGLFPNYYSFTQDLTTRHQGKVTGTLGACCWVAMAAWQGTLGRVFDATGSYTAGFVVAGVVPMVGFLTLLLLWGRVEEETQVEPTDVPAPVPIPAADERITVAGAVQKATS
jgi:ACS family hexuronate transporter-like MFS transporter